MKYIEKQKTPRVVEAYRYTGDPKNPGWPEGWLDEWAKKRHIDIEQMKMNLCCSLRTGMFLGLSVDKDSISVLYDHDDFHAKYKPLPDDGFHPPANFAALKFHDPPRFQTGRMPLIKYPCPECGSGCNILSGSLYVSEDGPSREEYNLECPSCKIHVTVPVSEYREKSGFSKEPVDLAEVEPIKHPCPACDDTGVMFVEGEEGAVSSAPCGCGCTILEEDEKLTACWECEHHDKQECRDRSRNVWQEDICTAGVRPRHFAPMIGQWIDWLWPKCDDVNTDGHCPHFEQKESE